MFFLLLLALYLALIAHPTWRPASDRASRVFDPSQVIGAARFVLRN